MYLINFTLQVFQRRKDGSVKFGRTWDDYAGGFGSADGEIWLGIQEKNTKHLI